MVRDLDAVQGGSQRRFALLLACATGLALAVWPAALVAQTAAAEQAAAGDQAAATDQDSEESATRVPEAGEQITVTARKREENVQEVPVAVTVKTGEALEDSQAADISTLQGEVPNLAVYAGRNQNSTMTAFLRGIGQADPLWGVDPGVGLYFDDVYIARPQGALLDVFDVQRIEVLRGPQGTLYGKNTIGGAIKYVSSPLGDRPMARVAVTGGSFNEQDVRALLGGAAAGGKVRAKVAFSSQQHDGYGTNLFTGRDVSDKNSLAYRGALEFLPSDRFRVALSYDHSDDDAEPKGHTRLAANPFCLNRALGGDGNPCPPEAHIFDTRSGLAPLNSATSSGTAMTMTWTASPSWTLKSITAYREGDSKNNIDFDTTPNRIADVIATYFDRQTSEELQAIYTGAGRFSGVLGAYYFDGKAGGLVKNIFFNAAFNTTDGNTKTESFALFGDGSYRVNDRLTLDVGLRATQEKKTTRAQNSTFLDDQFTRFLRYEANFDKSKTFDSVAPKLGLDYRFTDTVMGYFTLSRGFKSGGFNVRAQARVLPATAEPFDDEILDVGEVGLKSVLLDNHLVLNGAAFYGKYKDIQVSTFTSYDSNGDGTEDSFLGNFLNAGDATVKGVEVELDWTATAVDWFGLSGQVSYLDAEPDDFLDANHNGVVDTQVITNAPKYTGALRANVDFPLFGGLVTGSVGAAYRDDSVLTNEGEFGGRPLAPITQDAYTLLDAWVGWLSPDAKWRFGVSGRNLTDKEYLTNGYNIPVLGVLQGSYGNPRTITATLEYRFF